MLRRLVFPFWNLDERRPRAAWRLGVHLLLLIAVYAVMGLSSHGLRRLAQGAPEWELAQGALFLPWAGLVVGTVWVAGRLLDRRPFREFGLVLARGFWTDAAFGAGLGFLLMAGILGAEASLGLASYATPAPTHGSLPRLAYVPVAVVAYVAVAINEELVFRGYHLLNIAEGLSGRRVRGAAALWLAVALSSLVFGAFHLGNPGADAVSTGNIAMAGLMLAAGYVTTGNLAIPIGLHFGWNFFQNLFGMPVSGTEHFFFSSVLVRTEHGPDWLTGGGFGPEAGITGLIAMVVGTVVILVWVRARRGRLGVHPRWLGLGETTASSAP